MRKLALAATLVLLLPFAAQSATEDERRDALVSEALRGAILGQPDRIRRAAEAEARVAPAARDQRLAGNISKLALAVERPIPDMSDWHREIPRSERDVYTRTIFRLARRTNDWERFLEARRDRKYQGVRRFYNSVLLPVAYVAQGQFIAAIFLPVEAAESLVMRQRFLDPEQRTELQEATTLVARHPGNRAMERKTETVRDQWPARRQRLAELQATSNINAALDSERYVAAEFWLNRLTALRNALPHGEKSYRRYADVTSELTGRRRTTISVANGESRMSPPEFAAYGEIVRTFVWPGAKDDEERRDLGELVLAFAVDHPNSVVRPAMEAAEAARARTAGDTLLAAAFLESIERQHPASSWAERAHAIRHAPPFGADFLLNEALAEINASRSAFLFRARLPRPENRSHSAEEARLWRLTIFARARALFITDTLARLLFYPLMPPFPREPLVDAAGVVDPAYFATPAGRKWLGKVAHAQDVEGRHESAAANWRTLGRDGRAAKSRHRAARVLERQGLDAPSPGTTVQAYERLLNAYPQYRHRRRVEDRLVTARLERDARAVVTREELRRWPEILRTLELPGGTALVEPGQGISDDGLYILHGDRVVYTDRRTSRRIELPAPEAQLALAHLEARRRLYDTRDELRQPLPRKRVPFAVEAGFFPGLDLAPQLVPLAPDPQRRKLYE